MRGDRLSTKSRCFIGQIRIPHSEASVQVETRPAPGAGCRVDLAQGPFTWAAALASTTP
jgi:hypothetical protein